MMHRTHMGVDNGWQSLLLQGLRNALSDGWGGSMIATEVSDILFGVPTPHPTFVNAGVLKEDEVNIIVHGHNPVVSEMVSKACQSPDMLNLAKAQGAKGINLAGVCCTGNELLMRRGIAMAGNHLMTELILSTGAVEMMIVDYQCIMPSLGTVAACYHTKMISTSDKAKFPGMEHHEFHPDNAEEKAVGLVKTAIENYARRGQGPYPGGTPTGDWRLQRGNHYQCPGRYGGAADRGDQGRQDPRRRGHRGLQQSPRSNMTMVMSP